MALDGTRANKLIESCMGLGNMPVVLGYHRVVERVPAGNIGSIPAMLISQAMLEHHLDWLGRRFRFVSLDELGEHMESGEPFKHPVAAVTFDDGYRDFYDLAFPLLKRKGIPAAVFVVTDLVDTGGPYDHDRLYLLLTKGMESPAARCQLAALFAEFGIGWTEPAEEGFRKGIFAVTDWVLGSLPQAALHLLMAAMEMKFRPLDEILERPSPLTWEMLHTMVAAGVTIGSHTKTHPLLTNEGWRKQSEETCEARQVLEQKLGTRVKHFAYPGGRFDALSVRAVAAAGYPFAYTTCLHRDRNHPLLTIPRKLLWEQSCVDVTGGFSSALMGCQVHRAFDALFRCRLEHGERVEGRCPVPQLA